MIGSDVLAKTLDPADRGTVILFGDGAGAFVVEASEERAFSPPIYMQTAATATC